jgi:hypothetical protein
VSERSAVAVASCVVSRASQGPAQLVACSVRQALVKMLARDIIQLEPGWEKMRVCSSLRESTPLLRAPSWSPLPKRQVLLQTGIDKLITILENREPTFFTAEEYMTLYTTTYNMCTQRAPHDYSEPLYVRYREAFQQYLTDKVRASPSTMAP